MNEASYTAWDDNLYEWPPPERWYQAEDGKWWPEGYGPTGDGRPDEAAPGASGDDDAELSEELLLEVEKTSIFPAGGSGLAGSSANSDRIAAESQRPVYDELPSIDDVFGGMDPFADDDDEPDDADHAEADAGDDGEAPAEVPDGSGGYFTDDESQASSGEYVASHNGSGTSGASGLAGLVDVGSDDDGADLEADSGEPGHGANGRVGGDEIREIDDGFSTEDEDLDRFEGSDEHHNGEKHAFDGGLEVGEYSPTEANVDLEDGVNFDDGGDLDDGVSIDDRLDDDENLDADLEFDDLDSRDQLDDRDYHDDLDDGHRGGRRHEGSSPPLVSSVQLGELPSEQAEGRAVELRDDSGEFASDRHAAHLDIDADLDRDAELDRGAELDRDAEHGGDGSAARPRWGWFIFVAGLAAALAVAGIVSFLLLNNDATPDERDLDEIALGTGAGSFNEPYGAEVGVVVLFEDQPSGEQRSWVIEVVEQASDLTESLVAEQGATAPADGNILATTRLKVTYQMGPVPGDAAVLELNALGDSLTLFDDEASCSSLEDQLVFGSTFEPGDEVEGNLCWEIPETDLADLKLAIEATPVEGIVFLALG